MSTTGEKPGKGAYVCINCGQVVELNNNDDTLPPCPQCDHTDFRP
jgi:DNA-directed RNA polymerase subunit RPC12/RpoP